MNILELQKASQDIYESKYQLKSSDGKIVDRDINETYMRVANALASVEKDPSMWKDVFYRAMLDGGAIPAGRIMSNLGGESYKTNVSPINCTVSQTIDDSMDGILDSVKNAGMTLKSGAGIGYEFSTLRPKGSIVSGAGASTSGPLSFMDIFDKMCGTISSAGARRGAQMATFDISHPDILDFIKSKREDGKFRHFNLSVLVTDDFMECLNNHSDWNLVFPLIDGHLDIMGLGTVYKKMKHFNKISNPNYSFNERGEVLCQIYSTIKAQELWDIIMKSNYDFAEPGIIFIDRVNKYNNINFLETIRATNPCGEQPLGPNGACLLGSINLTRHVKNPFTDNAKFNFNSFISLVRTFTRMLDNVVDLNNLPLKAQQDEILKTRRHGMGYFGLGSALVMLGMAYDSPEAEIFTEKVTACLVLAGWEVSTNLAKEKGKAPILEDAKSHFKFINSNYFTKLAEMLLKDEEIYHELNTLFDVGKLWSDLDNYGSRFTHHSSIAPTGTIALSFGNNASNGIEPSFSHYYLRNVIVPGKKTKEQIEVRSYENLLFDKMNNNNINRIPDKFRKIFVPAEKISPKDHIKIQAAAQKWIDSSISKTINVSSDYDFDKFKNIYLYAYRKGLKGCTTYRSNPEFLGEILVQKESLQNTKYEFTLEDGEVIILSGDESINYDGEIHNVANLFNALKEGTYGKS